MRNAIFTLLVIMVASSAMAAPPKTTYTLHSDRQPGATDHVVINVKVHGETKFIEKGKPQSEKMSLVCDLEYDEKTLEVPAKTDELWRSVRSYTNASALVNVAGDEIKPTLRPDRRLICAEATGQTTLLFSPRGAMTRSELELIEAHANSLLLDQLLPDKAVAINDTWDHSEHLMAALFGLDEVAKTDVRSQLKEVTDKVARFEIEGKIEGAIHGAPSKIEVKGKYRFDLRSKRIDWIALLIKEDRQASLMADDGVDASSVFQMTIRQVADSAELSEAALKDLSLKSSPEATKLTYESIGKDWRFDHDRRWYVYRNHPTSAVLQRLDRGEVIGQCNVSSLPERAPDKLVGLEEFQEDVRRALDKSFGQFVETSQKPDAADHRVLRVVAEGTSSDLPIQWTYYHVADARGRQAAFTFTVEKSLLERFGDSDKLLIESIRFAEPSAKPSDEKSAGKETKADEAKGEIVQGEKPKEAKPEEEPKK